MIHGDEGGEINGMNVWQGKLKYSEKSCPIVTLSTQVQYDLAQARTWATVVGSQWHGSQLNKYFYFLALVGFCERRKVVSSSKKQDCKFK
jgi:hypothetical protein